MWGRVLSAIKRVRAIQPAIFSWSVETPRAGASLTLVALILLAPAMAGCGKKNEPTPPPGVPDTYPLPYPRE